MSDIEIEINGQKVAAKSDQMLIQAADAAGIYIPRFCYHAHLSVAANCRMCLVEVEKVPKPLPACATPVMPGMKVFTQSAKTLAAQRAVMEFLLINHPLDCPICDQGGECELQDLSMGYGASVSHYDECKRAVADKDIGPLIATEMTRCIQCTRCVRFGEEVAGLRELGAIDRGEQMTISTYVEHAMKSEVSGNIIDLCPVGALTSKPFRFKARAWELNQAPSVGPHDCVGSNIYVHTRYGKVLRVVARENVHINETWISDRDRFSYEGLYHPERLSEPLARVNGKLQVISWEKAIEIVAAGFRGILDVYGADQLAALASPNSTLEEFYLLQKFMRGLGSPHIDHRLREMNFRDQADFPAFPGLGMSFAELEQCDAVLLIGSNIQKEQPMVGLRLRQAARKGAVMMAVNSLDYRFHFALQAKKIAAPHQLAESLAAIVKALATETAASLTLPPELADIVVDDPAQAIAQQLRGKKKACLLLGAVACHHPEAATLRYLAQWIAQLSGAHLSFLSDGANSAGGWLAGAVPHRLTAGVAMAEPGLNADTLLKDPRRAYLLLNVEPGLDCAHSGAALSALKQAEFVVALSMYRNPVLAAHADVVLPMAPFTETAGTFVNVCGEWQSFTGVAAPYHASRPAWKILCALARVLQLEGFDYAAAENVRHEIKTETKKMSAVAAVFSRPNDFSLRATSSKLSRIGEVPLYAVDSLVRRSEPLQKAQTIIEGEVGMVRIHPTLAKTLQIQEGQTVAVRQKNAGEVSLPVVLDVRVPEQAVWVAGGIAATVGLGELFGEIEIRK